MTAADGKKFPDGIRLPASRILNLFVGNNNNYSISTFLMRFGKEDLNGRGYTWGDEPRKVDSIFFREPSRRLFDRASGPQVLWMINYYGGTVDDFDIGTGRIIEWEITNHLPESVRSEISVFAWIVQWVMQSADNK